jgi:hypothetical protein
MTIEIAGLPARDEPNGLMTPLAAVAVIRGLNNEGEIHYWIARTEDAGLIDAIGMHESAAHIYKNRLPR